MALGSDLSGDLVNYGLAAVLIAFWATGCVMPHVERTRAAVHGIVLQDGAPAAGVVVRRCLKGCDDTEQVHTNPDGFFDLPAHHKFGMFILPIPYDPISEVGFDLEVGNLVYCGLPSGGIGRPPRRYAVACELAGAVPKQPQEPPGSGVAKPTCRVIRVEQ